MPVSNRTRINGQVKEFRDNRKSNGLCIECGQVSERLRCEICQAKNRDAVQRLREKKRANSLCSMCGGPRDSDKTMCSSCVERQSEYAQKSYEKRVGEKKCVSCGKTNETELMRCPDCQEKANEWGRQRKARYTAEGKCRECGAEAQISNRTLRGGERGNYCKDCWFKVLAGYLLGSRKNWQILIEKLDACGWRCPYTGEPLVLGDNLSFDHMDPVCRFPERQHDPNNLEPISWQVNLMKRDLTKSEFLALIERIYLHGHVRVTP